MLDRQLRRTPHPSAPPLWAFAHIGPFRILGHIPQAGHDGAEDRRIGVVELKIPHKIVATLLSVAVGGMIEAAVDARDAGFGGEGMPLGDHLSSVIITREEKTFTAHPVHGPPVSGLVLWRHHSQRKSPPRSRQ